MAVFAGMRDTNWAAEAAFCLLIVFAFAFVLSTPQPATAQDEPAAGDRSEAVQPQPRLFTHIITSAGPVFGLILLAVSIALVALIVLLAMDLRPTVAIPPAFVQEFTD